MKRHHMMILGLALIASGVVFPNPFGVVPAILGACLILVVQGLDILTRGDR